MLKFTADEFEKIDLKTALRLAMDMPEIRKIIDKWDIERSNYVYYPHCHGILSLSTRSSEKVKEIVEQ